jgi:phage FluMu protein Com
MDNNKQEDLTLSDLRTDYKEPEPVIESASPERLAEMSEADTSQLPSPPSADEASVAKWNNDIDNLLQKAEDVVLKEADEFFKTKEEIELERELEGDDEGEEEPVVEAPKVVEQPPARKEPPAVVEEPPKKKVTAVKPKPKEEDEDLDDDTEPDVAFTDATVVKQLGDAIDDDDFKDLDEEESEEEAKKDKKRTEEFKVSIAKKLNVGSTDLDLSEFTVSNSVSALNSVLNTFDEDRVADWVLLHAGRPFSVKEFRAIDIEKLDPDHYESRSALATYRDIYTHIYNHIQDANKPDTFEQWAKTVPFADSDNLYFGAYLASFEGSNYLPYYCPECKNRFVSDNLPMSSLYKFKTPELETRFKEIRSMDPTSPEGGPKQELLLKQVTDSVAMGFKLPTLYDLIVGATMIDPKFNEKYREYVDLCSYIETIYMIDKETRQLHPLSLKSFPTDVRKTVMYKVKAVAKILEKITSDQLGKVTNTIEDLTIKDEIDGITYVKPEMTCPKCETLIAEEEVKGSTVLFIRHPLVRIATSVTR